MFGASGAAWAKLMSDTNTVLHSLNKACEQVTNPGSDGSCATWRQQDKHNNILLKL
jgi:hypothetical protein